MRGAVFSAFLLLFWAACSDSEPPPEELCPVSLVDHIRWTLVDSSSTAANGGACGPENTTMELFSDGTPSFSIITLECSHATVEQPIQESVLMDEPIRIRLYRYDLIQTSSDAQAMIDIDLDDSSLFHRVVPLPAEAELIDEKITAPKAAAEGSPIRWSVKNHGTNSYNLIDITVDRSCD